MSRAALRAMARPMPVPEYSSSVWSRAKTSKIRSWYSVGMPIPLSATLRTTVPSRCVASTRICGGTPSRRYVSALETKLSSTCSTSVWSPTGVASGRATSRRAPGSVSWFSNVRHSRSTTGSSGTGTRRSAPRPSRE